MRLQAIGVPFPALWDHSPSRNCWARGSSAAYANVQGSGLFINSAREAAAEARHAEAFHGTITFHSLLSRRTSAASLYQ